MLPGMTNRAGMGGTRSSRSSPAAHHELHVHGLHLDVEVGRLQRLRQLGRPREFLVERLRLFEPVGHLGEGG